MCLLRLKHILLLISVCFGMASCKTTPEKNEKTPAVELTDSCKLNPEHSYEVFIPSIKKSHKNLPLLVVIDPHGDGKLALSKFKNAAIQYSAIVVASNIVQNNDPNYMHELEELIEDAKEKYTAGNILYMSGFSGGSRMALNYAAAHPVNGVIACGAFAGQDQIAALKCRTMAITGMDDFNFSEVAQFILSPEKIPSNVFIEIIEASHAWPEENILTGAFGFLQLSETQNENFVGKAQVQEYIQKQQLRIDSLKQCGEMIRAEMLARNMTLVEDFGKASTFSIEAEEIAKDNLYKQQQNQLLNSIRFEMKVREAYFKAFDVKDEAWWKIEITSLNDKIASEPDPIKRSSYQRIKGFLGIACYSNCNRFVSLHDIRGLEETLVVYRLIEPDNTDMMHFTKILEQLKYPQ